VIYTASLFQAIVTLKRAEARAPGQIRKPSKRAIDFRRNCGDDIGAIKSNPIL